MCHRDITYLRLIALYVNQIVAPAEEYLKEEAKLFLEVDKSYLLSFFMKIKIL